MSCAHLRKGLQAAASTALTHRAFCAAPWQHRAAGEEGGSGDSEHNLIESSRDTTRIDSATDTGFVVNSVHTRGAVIAYGPLWMMWRAVAVADVTPESLALLHLTKPVPDLLVLGSGAARQLPPQQTLRMLEELSVGLEVLPTAQAIQYFNLLSQERRNVACALLLDSA